MSDPGNSSIYITIERGSAENIIVAHEKLSVLSGVQNSDNQNRSVVSSYVKCAVPRCNNYFDGRRQEFMGISYFPFPSDPELKKEWIDEIGLPANLNTDDLKVCSQHFLLTDFQSPESALKLRPSAKPRNVNMNVLGIWDDKLKGCSDISNVTLNASTIALPATEDPIKLKTSEEVDNEPVMPVITSVVTMNVSPKHVIHNAIVVDDEIPTSVSEINADSHKRPAILRGSRKRLASENVISKTQEPSISNTIIEQTPSTTKHKGLIVVPATVKLPPLLPRPNLSGDSIVGNDSNTTSQNNEEKTEVVSVEPNITVVGDTVIDDVEDSSNPDCQSESFTGTMEEGVPVQKKKKRNRSNREEMMRREEEDEWTPSIWVKKTLVKDGWGAHLIADKKRMNESKLKNNTAKPISDDIKKLEQGKEEASILEGPDEEDAGWRYVEPIATGDKKEEPNAKEENESRPYNPMDLLEVSSDDKVKPPDQNSGLFYKKRPGPLSKTLFRVQPSDNSQTKNDPQTVTQEQTKSQEQNEKKDEDAVTADNPVSNEDSNSASTSQEPQPNPSIFLEWAFFKSLLPDLCKLNNGKRNEFKTFVLDTLNSSIYEKKPITFPLEPPCEGSKS